MQPVEACLQDKGLPPMRLHPRRGALTFPLLRYPVSQRQESEREEGRANHGVGVGVGGWPMEEDNPYELVWPRAR
jgi:hypothetical protein